MTSQTLKRAGLRFGLATAVTLALCAFAAVGSASAATQHWASAPQLPYGSSVEYSGEATTSILFEWDIFFEEVHGQCNSLSTSGYAKDPAGGGAGTFSAKSFELGGCDIEQPAGSGCEIKNESIVFEKLAGEAIGESGEDLIEYQPASGAYAATLMIENCVLEGQYPVEGTFSASAVSDGEYAINPQSTELTSIGGPFSLTGRYALSTPSEEPLSLSSDGAPGTPHWFIGNPEWANLGGGASTAYSSSGPMSFDLESELFFEPIEIACSGSGNKLEGTVENPTGGGPGVATGTITFGECSIPAPEGSGCTLKTPSQSEELSGVTTEVGKESTPAVELSAKSGVLADFQIENCILEGTYSLEGGLVASASNNVFQLSGNEATLFREPASISGHMALETEAGEALRIQP